VGIAAVFEVGLPLRAGVRTWFERAQAPGQPVGPPPRLEAVDQPIGFDAFEDPAGAVERAALVRPLGREVEISGGVSPLV
jgi:hypothetical protein